MIPPSEIDGAKVIQFASLETGNSGKALHTVSGREIAEFSALAIAQYKDDPGVYLFYCDARWRAITDTYHDSVKAAHDQAVFEFGSVEFEAR